ncbi:response regulator [Dechloromonas sp. TW-R-39-2]|uniref:response regulator transcription factor n=1 Tax=Dechloromonas TaxID=73029 RepID=UPI00193DA7CF|nr:MULTISPECIES: response regulator transcription factor [Dechloromonas]QRM18496.1 response regulator [Dechloromonas sp. TW-R-39-2]UCV11926.1 response regulator transcription factor [Dechloromonas denitrificans]
MKEAESPKLIAIVEDDPDVARIIEQVLGDFSFRTVWCRSASDLLRRLRTLQPDLCIIDLGLPDMDGLEVMQRVRAITACGIVILTGRAHVSDRVMGLELGADDYVLKPFEPRELVARVRSILRRRETGGQENGTGRQIAEFGGWRFNLANNALLSPNGEEQLLSTTEAELLKVFINHPNRILQREQLMGMRDLSPTDRSIDVRISRLRRKLEPNAESPAFIKTVYGAGYLFLASINWLTS